MDPLEHSGVYEFAAPVFGPLARTVGVAWRWMIEAGCPAILATLVLIWFYLGSMMAPLVVLKWSCPGLYRKRGDRC